MCKKIAQQRDEGTTADFIIVTGDISFSGKAEEYALAAEFFKALSEASGVLKERIFCVPGNHDVDRDRQKLCFLGARTFLVDQNRTDALLAGGEDLETLLKRLENFLNFQKAYFTGQERTLTADGLGYVSRLTIDDLQLALVCLNSAWLSEGGKTDHGKILLGERQVINAIDLAKERGDPDLILGMAHHPIHLLGDFDIPPVQNRIERGCNFFHCGHLHEPGEQSRGAGCLMIAAGASFETRQFHNTYSIITLDLLSAVRSVRTVQYIPGNGSFSSTSTEQYPIEVSPVKACRVSELAEAMQAFHPALKPRAHYLSALLLDQKTELPIPVQDMFTFGSFEVLKAQPDSDLRHKTRDFMTFRNALGVLCKRTSLSRIFELHGALVVNYGTILNDLCNSNPALKTRITEFEKDAKILASTEPIGSFSHSDSLLDDLASAEEWVQLRSLAQRLTDSHDPAIVTKAKRMLALSLANSEEKVDRTKAMGIFRLLTKDVSAKVGDFGYLATLLVDSDNIEDAKAVVLEGINKFKTAEVDRLVQVGQRIVEKTGDRDFRKQIEKAKTERSQRD